VFLLFKKWEQKILEIEAISKIEFSEEILLMSKVGIEDVKYICMFVYICLFRNIIFILVLYLFI
jgi:hypothetical protein